MAHVCSRDCSFTLSGPRPVCKRSGHVHECSTAQCLRATPEGDVVCTWTGLAHDARVDGGYGKYSAPRGNDPVPTTHCPFQDSAEQTACPRQESVACAMARNYATIQQERGTPLTDEEREAFLSRMRQDMINGARDVAPAGPTESAGQPMPGVSWSRLATKAIPALSPEIEIVTYGGSWMYGLDDSALRRQREKPSFAALARLVHVLVTLGTWPSAAARVTHA
jgi:hypothetical protein